MAGVVWSEWWAHANQLFRQKGINFWLLDKDGHPFCEVREIIDYDLGDSALDMAEGKVTIFADNEVVPWLLGKETDGVIGKQPPRIDHVLHDAVHLIAVTGEFQVMGYRVHELQYELGGKRGGTMEIIGIRPREHFKHIVLKSNTHLPDQFQLKWSDIQQGPALNIIKSYIHRNLERQFQPNSLLGQWNLEAINAWDKVRPSVELWPIFMNPKIDGPNTEWAVIEARYDNAYDCLNKTATASGTMLTAEYWLPGMKQPCPDYVTFKTPTIILDAVNRSFHPGATGTIKDGIRGIQRRFSAILNQNVDDLPVFSDGAGLTHLNLPPWVVWKPNQYHAVSKVTFKKSTDSVFVVGGKSPAALNKILSIGWSALVKGIGSFFPGVGPFFAEIIAEGGKEAVKDRILAFQTYDQNYRKEAHGRLRYREVSKPGEAYSISSVQAAMAAMEETGGGISFDIAVVDGAPYQFGRDYRVGDQVGVEMLGMIMASFVSEVHIQGDRGKRNVTVSLGDPRIRESSTAMLAHNVETISGILSRLKTQIGQ